MSMSRRLPGLLLLPAFLLCTPISAQEVATDSTTSASGEQETGVQKTPAIPAYKPSRSLTQTRSLLEMQRHGTFASSSAKTVSGEEMQRIYQRYLDSFTHDIPDQYTELEFAPD